MKKFAIFRIAAVLAAIFTVGCKNSSDSDSSGAIAAIAPSPVGTWRATLEGGREQFTLHVFEGGDFEMDFIEYGESDTMVGNWQQTGSKITFSHTYFWNDQMVTEHDTGTLTGANSMTTDLVGGNVTFTRV